MQTYSEKAAVDALKATRQILEQGYIAKAKYDEDVAGINRRFESVSDRYNTRQSYQICGHIN